MIREIENLEQYYDTKVLGQGSSIDKNSVVHFSLASAARDAVSDTNSAVTPPHSHTAFSSRWVPPSSGIEDYDGYHTQVLREDGYL
jgi:hypothetical protein